MSLIVPAWSSISVWPLFRFERELQQVCSEADQIVVDFNAMPSDEAFGGKIARMPSVPIGGAEKVKEFADILRFKVPGFVGHCRCFGELAFRLDKGGKPFKKLTFHHGESLRWCSLDCGTPNFELTESSRKQLMDWLAKNGGPALEQARAQAEAIWKDIADQSSEEPDSTSRPATRSGPAGPVIEPGCD